MISKYFRSIVDNKLKQFNKGRSTIFHFIRRAILGFMRFACKSLLIILAPNKSTYCIKASISLKFKPTMGKTELLINFSGRLNNV